MPEYRYNDRAVQLAFADNCAPAYEFLIENGVKFIDAPPDVYGGHAIGLLRLEKIISFQVRNKG